jgi:hypothetical protein
MKLSFSHWLKSREEINEGSLFNKLKYAYHKVNQYNPFVSDDTMFHKNVAARVDKIKRAKDLLTKPYRIPPEDFFGFELDSGGRIVNWLHSQEEYWHDSLHSNEALLKIVKAQVGLWQNDPVQLHKWKMAEEYLTSDPLRRNYPSKENS